MSVYVLGDDPNTRIREELESRPDLFSSWDIVGIFHPNSGPSDILCRLDGTVSPFEGLDNCEEDFSGFNAGLDGFV